MNNPAKTILELTGKQVLDFLMDHKQFCSFELPEYFSFQEVLNYVRNTIGEKSFDECLASNKRPEQFSDTCLNILCNKDGKYGIRPLTLPNPYIYYFLAREISANNNWKRITNCFNRFQVPHFSCGSIPVIPEEKEIFNKSTVILNWWNKMEQRSLELSLEYRYMFVTDITNCYGSINPQTIDWALTMKDTQHKTNANHNLAKNIMSLLKDMQEGRNIGIPQGGTIFDLIAEIILGYADILLYDKLEKKGITEYEILRYRDDYRVFCDDRGMLEEISYTLQEVLESLNFRMNDKKTMVSQNPITDCIKSDKLWYIKNTPIFNKKGCDFDGFQKHLLYILMFGREFPNCGQLKNLLNDLEKRLLERLKPRPKKKKNYKVLFTLGESVDLGLDTEKTNEADTDTATYQPKLKESIRPMVAVATQIAVENMNITHYALKIISRLVDTLGKDQLQERWDIVNKVRDRLIGRPNSRYDQLWLQNITYKEDLKTYDDDIKNGTYPYDLPLCRLAMEEDVQLWNNSWLKPKLTSDIPYSTVCDRQLLANVAPIITFRETREYFG